MAEWGKIYLIVFVYFKCFEMWDGAKNGRASMRVLLENTCTCTSVYKIKKKYYYI